MKKIALLLGLLLPILSLGAITEQDRSFITPRNLLKNPGFEFGKANWTASGGTFTITTTAANVGTGNSAASWDSSAAAQTFTSSAVTIPPGLYGTNAFFRCRIQTPTGTATHTIAAYDGTTSYNAITVTSSTTYSIAQANFIMPSSGTIAIQIKSVASNEPNINVDDCYVGVADNIGAGPITIPWKSDLTFTYPASWGTTTNNSVEYRRVANAMDVHGSLTAGTTTAAACQILLPTGYTIDTTGFQGTGNKIVGQAFVATGSSTNVPSTTNGPFNIFYDGSTTSGPFISDNFASSDVTKSNCSHFISSGNKVLYYFSLPISQFSDVSVFRPDQTPASWSGYTNGISGGCSTSSSTYADTSSCTGIAINEQQNRNMGTVTTAGSSLPGITFTPAKGGKWNFCAQANVLKSTAGGLSMKLVSGSGDVSKGVSQSLSDTFNGTISVCGEDNLASGTAYTLKLQLATNSGSVSIVNGIASGTPAINWQVWQGDVPMTSPFMGIDSAYASGLLSKSSQLDVDVTSSSWTTYNSASYTGWSYSGLATAPSTSSTDLGIRVPNLPSGRYLVVARGGFLVASAAADCNLAIYDGTNREAVHGSRSAGSVQGMTEVSAIFEYTTTASRDFLFQAVRNGGTGFCRVTIDNSTAGNSPDFRMTVIPLNQFITTTGVMNLAGQVTSQSQGSERLERATIANNGTCSVTSQSGTWVTSLSHPGTGRCVLNYVAWSSAPSCVCTGDNQTTTGARTCSINVTPTTTSLEVGVFNSGTSATDQPFHILCMGPR